MQDITLQLQKMFKDRLKIDEPLLKHLNFRIGGPAKWFVEVSTIEELQHALKIAKDADVPTFVLGGGSNTLGADVGFDGLVVKLAMREFSINGTTVRAEAGVITAALARATANVGLSGFAWAVSLPGTIGGAVRGNAGCFGGEMRDSISKVEVLRDGKIIELSKEDLHFGYRESSIKNSNDIVLSVTLELEIGDALELKDQLVESLEKRKGSQPLYAGSAGCIFKNFEFTQDAQVDQLRQQIAIPESMMQNKRISAGWIIDQLGLKGTRIGDASISEEHGNFIINHGNATASDVKALIDLVKSDALTKFGIQLIEEVQYLK
ncbi:MAG: UDP-N-acetylmuramate dehydrogenase [Candidatus Uhrbacteria bacterium]|nr:UDP-N-acetylmuramate dehydrogenase [Candidatus Uhrbacteria bacterium]